MQRILIAASLLLFAVRPGTASVPCGGSALDAAPDRWDPTTAVTGDLTLDGEPDVVFWRPDSASVLLYIVSCSGDDVGRTWRMRIPLAADVTPERATVEIASLLIDDELVERACRPGEAARCAHVRAENTRRQQLAGAGRSLRIRGPSWSGWRLFWSAEMGGFVRIAG